MMRPFSVGAFVDFYSSEHHASNVGKMFRPQGDPLLPNWKHLPVGYNGRASTVLPSGIPIVRPCGQSKPPDAETPVFGPSKALDFELEMGFFLGAESPFWRPIPADEADQFIFGLVLVNDWSARDIQAWEYQPLGPFLSKSFATSISDWVVTLEALEPWACDGPPQDPEPLAYLRTNQKWHYDIQLEVAIQTKRMTRPQTICRSNARHLYWSIAQQLAHQTINGTHVSEGDLYASGTISGPTPESRGCMLELTWRGQDPIVLHETGETRSWIEDGDTVIMRGWCDGTGYRIGFGELRTKVFGTLEALAEAYR
jgi:fumarylacetoacetase